MTWRDDETVNEGLASGNAYLAAHAAVAAERNRITTGIKALSTWEMEWVCDPGGEWQVVLNRAAVLAVIEEDE